MSGKGWRRRAGLGMRDSGLAMGLLGIAFYLARKVLSSFFLEIFFRPNNQRKLDRGLHG